MPKDKSKGSSHAASVAPVNLDFQYLLAAAARGDVTIQCGKATLTTCHSCVLVARAPSLAKLAKKGKKGQTIILDETKSHADGDALGCLINYLYLGRPELPKSIVAVLRVGVLAQEWKLERLRWHVENRLRNGLDIKNIFDALAEADDLKDETLKLLCVVYAVSHWVEVTSNMTDANAPGGLRLAPTLFTELVQLQTKNPAAPLEEPEPPELILENFRKLYETKDEYDETVNVGSKSIKVHKPILAERSEPMARLFESGKSKGDQKDPLKGLASASFETLLRYLYYKDENIDPQAAAELVPFCQTHKLSDLRELCEGKIQSNINADTVLDIIRVAYDKTMAQRQDLQADIKDKAIRFIVEELASLDLEPLRKMQPEISVDILLACQEKEGGGPKKPVTKSSTTTERSKSPLSDKGTSKRGDLKEEEKKKKK
jgi:hypothetical protein